MLNKLIFVSFMLSLMTSPVLAANCPQATQWGFPSHKIARVPSVSERCKTDTVTAPTYKKEEARIESVQVSRQDSAIFINTASVDLLWHKIARMNFALSLARPVLSGQAYSAMPSHKQAR
jgi:hypothetical protein